MDSGRWIDPEILAVLESMPPLFDELNDDRLPGVRQTQRQALAQMTPLLSPDLERTDHRVPGPDGAPEVVVRVHRPIGLDRPAPCLYWMHGGGYVLGSYLADDLRLQRLCLELGCIATSVEYRLSPETPYPGALEDCYAGLRWVHHNATTLGVDPHRTGIGGGSAGGGLAAALALLARDRAQVPVPFQLLIYPMVDDRAVTESSGWDLPIWRAATNRYGWRSYLGSLDGTDRVSTTAAPARATDLAGLPPAFVCVGSADRFLDEDVAYAQALQHAGVPTELHVYPGGVHGFETVMPEAGLSLRARRDITDWLGRQMGAAG